MSWGRTWTPLWTSSSRWFRRTGGTKVPPARNVERQPDTVNVCLSSAFELLPA